MITKAAPQKPSMPIVQARSYVPPSDIATFQQEAAKILLGTVSMGRWVEKFQQAAAAAHDGRFALATNSCTAALETAMLACGVRPRDQVIVPVQTFIATGMAVHNIGARPVFADIRLDTLCLDPDELSRLASDRVKAVIHVHFGGLIPPEVVRIQQICRERGWALIEDAAHAHGARFEGRAAGAFGDAACFSYYPTKVLTAGEGGMIVTDDRRIANICRSYQLRGQGVTLPGEQFCRPYGRNIRMPELSALLGFLQYGHLDRFVRARRSIAAIYDTVLAEETSIVRQCVPAGSYHNYWLYPILLPPGVDRRAIRSRCKQRWDIQFGWSYFPPLHLMPVFRELYGTKWGDLPVAEDLLSRTLCLPMHPRISEDDARCVAECVLHEYRQVAGQAVCPTREESSNPKSPVDANERSPQ